MSQYSTFYLGERRFGLPILSVRELIRVCDITPVPLAPQHVRGLINLRGQIVTILDLAVRLGLKERSDAKESHVVILKSGESPASARERPGDEGGAAGEDMAGFLVDAVGDVVEAEPSLIEPVPANVTDTDNQCLQFVIKTGTGLLILLNLDSILGPRP